MMGEHVEGMYTIRQVADLLGVSTDAIRLYEKDGLVQPLRDESNGYRYYGVEQIKQIMIVLLYRQLDVSISDIRRLLQVKDFSHMQHEFSHMIDENRTQMRLLEHKNKQLNHMVQEMKNLEEGAEQYSVRTFPVCYLAFKEKSFENIDNIKEVLGSKEIFYGDFCFTVRKQASGDYDTLGYYFMVREDMMDICSDLMKERAVKYLCDRPCVYTVSSATNIDRVEWNLDGVHEFATSQGYECEQDGYAFYLFSLMGAKRNIDYYEVYWPIKE